VGNDARLPTQNTKFREGKLKSRGQSKKIDAVVPIFFLTTLFRKRAGAPGLSWSGLAYFRVLLRFGLIGRKPIKRWLVRIPLKVL